ncbi:LysR family transcriptional regulator [Ruegeria sp. HKCCD8929]|uniref:LysR family transcriptional regulator n=1 Tax=Ruegeria sp. HKCCD8929 TaxID=2683006 RepID=UPI00148987BA|nr:LysR family transcriptional regulator [Ruegeria sp. HKCCD8929]
MARKELSLRWLELFQTCAEKGSLHAAADEMGLSVSTVSHHLSNLEEHLGVALFDHARRPMVLTPTGRVFLRNIDDALFAIRKAKAEASAGNVADASYLRIGTIEDFDGDIMPELAVHLSETMPKCDFLYHTDASLSILEMLRNRHLDVGVASGPLDRLHDLEDRPLLRDPFVLIMPEGVDLDVQEVMRGKTELPFLRFSGQLMIARQIESQLRRMRIRLPTRFECANNLTLMAMVAAGAGWTISTPLLYSRARRFHPRLSMRRFPGKSFARTLTLVATPDCSGSVLDLVDTKLRELVAEHAVRPFHSEILWLRDSFGLID